MAGEDTCAICKTPIDDGYMYGAGDGTGQKFAHPLCFVKRENARLTALLAERDARIARLVEAGVVAIDCLERALGGVGGAASVHPDDERGNQDGA